MIILRLYFRALASGALVIATLLGAMPARAQTSAPQELTIQPTPADQAAALAARSRYRHERPANNAAGRAEHARRIAERQPQRKAGSTRHDRGILQYPQDVSYGGGKVLTSVVSHAIYLQLQPGGNCSVASCWGDPEAFLRDLSNSDFIHLVDQYVGASAASRYTVGFHATVNYASSGPLLDTDIQAIVHASAVKTGAAGYGHIYHVFLPPGQDECFDSTLDDCYSPDNEASWYFCAYHSSVDFPDIGHVVYTVEPYQNVLDCQVQPPTANGSLVDSADNVLSHELFESITDPDGDAWVNADFPWEQGEEVADECVIDPYTGAASAYYQVPTFLIGAHRYAVQLIYSNRQHFCGATR